MTCLVAAMTLLTWNVAGRVRDVPAQARALAERPVRRGAVAGGARQQLERRGFAWRDGGVDTGS